MRDIVDIRLRELQARLVERRIRLVVSDDVKKWLAERGYDPKYGARPLNRLISKQIGNGLADSIIRGILRNGQLAVVSIDQTGEGLVIEAKDVV